MPNRYDMTNRAVILGLAVVACLALAAGAGAANGGDQQLSPDVLAMRAAAAQVGVPDHELPTETPVESRLKKATRELWETKTTSPVRQVVQVMVRDEVVSGERRKEAPQYTTQLVSVDSSARLLVECAVEDLARFDSDFFTSIGGILVDRAWGYGLLVAWIPAEQLPSFAARRDVRSVRHIDPPYTDIGSILTQGDGIHNADDARDTFGIDGTGQLIGVISDGASSHADAQATNDLPADPPATPSLTIPAGCIGSGDEGTGMLEIVADLAPGADLAFCTGFPGTTGMVNAISTVATKQLWVDHDHHRRPAPPPGAGLRGRSHCPGQAGCRGPRDLLHSVGRESGRPALSGRLQRHQCQRQHRRKHLRLPPRLRRRRLSDVGDVTQLR